MKATKTKPEKPYDGYPLFAHANGQWARKIRGKLYYFGPWADPSAASEEYLRQRDYLYAGLRPPIDEPTVADVLNSFLGDKELACKTEEITAVTYGEYEATCDIIGEWGGRRQLSSIMPSDLRGLRARLMQGKTRQLGPYTFKRRLTITRMAMRHASKLGTPINYEDDLCSPAAKLLRKARNEAGERLFTAKQIRDIVKAAKGELKGMVLLGINCGFGPHDCVTLPTSRVDLRGGWHSYPRPKTEIQRRCPLWPETVKALRGATNNGRVFAERWNRHNIADRFRKLVDDFYVKNVTAFYTLRRTFETIATTADVSQAVIDAIMGHSRQDMASIYRQKVFDAQLRKCTDHVRAWYLGKIKLD